MIQAHQYNMHAEVTYKVPQKTVKYTVWILYIPQLAYVMMSLDNYHRIPNNQQSTLFEYMHYTQGVALPGIVNHMGTIRNVFLLSCVSCATPCRVQTVKVMKNLRYAG